MTFKNSNGREYEILAMNGRDMLLKEVGNAEWVCAWEVGKTCLGQGHYFMNEDDAKDYWYENYATRRI